MSQEEWDETDFDEAVRYCLNQLLERRKVSRAKLARDLGMKQTTFNRLVQEGTWKGSRITQICRILEVTPIELLSTYPPYRAQAQPWLEPMPGSSLWRLRESLNTDELKELSRLVEECRARGIYDEALAGVNLLISTARRSQGKVVKLDPDGSFKN